MIRNLRGLAVACVLALFLTACVSARVESAQARLASVCAQEKAANLIYVTLIAPHRPAAKVAKAKEWHDKVVKFCDDATTGSIAQRLEAVAKLIDQAIAARAAK